jgi:hypothetical protein
MGCERLCNTLTKVAPQRFYPPTSGESSAVRTTSIRICAEVCPCMHVKSVTDPHRVHAWWVETTSTGNQCLLAKSVCDFSQVYAQHSEQLNWTLLEDVGRLSEARMSAHEKLCSWKPGNLQSVSREKSKFF